MKILWTLLLLLTVSHFVHAELSSNYDFNFGFASIESKTAATATSVTGELTVDLNYNLVITTCRCTLTGTFQEFLKSNQGDLAFTRMAIGMRYYPFDTNSSRIILDSKTEGRIWRAAPFVGVEMGFSNLSVSKADELGRYFNSFSNDIGIRFGNEIPIGPGVIMLGHILAISSLSSSSSGSDANTQSSYTGFAVLLGLRFSAFD